MNTLAEQEFAFVAAQLTTEDLIELDRRVVDGLIDGGDYVTPTACGCFYGSIGLIQGVLESESKNRYAEGKEFRNSLLSDGLKQASYRLFDFTELEWEVSSIHTGATPETNPASAWLHGLLTAEIARRNA